MIRIKNNYLVAILAILAILLMLATLCSINAFAEEINADAYVIYVDGSAKDNSGNGSKNKPFKYLNQAQEYIKNDTSSEMNYVVKIAGGVYELDETFTIDVNNIKKSASVKYIAKDDNYPVISGGKRIEGKWKDEGNGIYSIELNRDKKLRSLYVNGQRCYMTSKKITPTGPDGSYTITAGSKDWAWLDGEVYTGVKFKSSVLPATTKNHDDIELVSQSTWNTTTVCVEKLETKGNFTVATFQMPYGALVQTLGWGNEYQFLKENTVYNVFEWLKNPGEFYFDKSAHKLYYIPREGENLNKADVVVPNLETIVEIKGENKANKVSNITFEKIIFENTDWNLMEVEGSYGRATNQANAALFAYAHKTENKNATDIIWHNDVYRSYDMGPAAISITSADNITLKNIIVRHTGNEGITLLNDVSNTTITGCGIYDTGASSIVVGHPQHMFIGDKGSDIGYFSDKEKYSIEEEALCFNITIEKSLFKDLCNLFPGCPGLTVYAADTFNIVDNQLINAPYCGISVGWGWWNMNGDDDCSTPGHASESINKANVSRNRIEDTLQVLSDGGAIYTLNEMRGSRCDENYIKNIGSKANEGTRIRGIHMDEGTRHLLGDKNVIEIDSQYACIDCGDWGRKGYNTWTNTYSTSKKNSTLSNMEVGTTCPVTYVADGNWPDEAKAVIENAGKIDSTINDMMSFEVCYYPGLSTAAIVAIICGAVAAVCIGLAAVLFFVNRRKKSKQVKELQQ